MRESFATGPRASRYGERVRPTLEVIPDDVEIAYHGIFKVTLLPHCTRRHSSHNQFMQHARCSARCSTMQHARPRAPPAQAPSAVPSPPVLVQSRRLLEGGRPLTFGAIPAGAESRTWGSRKTSPLPSAPHCEQCRASGLPHPDPGGSWHGLGVEPDRERSCSHRHRCAPSRKMVR